MSALRVAWADLRDLPAPPGEHHVWDPFCERGHVLGPLARALLAACVAPRSIEDHADHLGRSPAFARAGTPRIFAELTRLADLGLLIDPRAELDRIARSAQSTASDGARSVRAIGIPTRDRNESVSTSILGHFTSLARSGRGAEIVIADSSDDEREAEGAVLRATHVARNTAPSAPIDVRRIGRADRITYARRLAERAGAPEDLARFALIGAPDLGSDCGANRNALLLDHVDRVLLHHDDDAGAALRSAPDPSLPGACATTGDPSAWWFPDPAGADASADAPAADLFAAHEAWLGRSIADIASEQGDSFTWHRPHAAWILRARAAGAVRVTQTGAIGDCGMGSLLPYLFATGPSRARLLASEATYARAAETRLVARAAPQAAIADRSGIMGFSMGLDARTLLPPFTPFGRDSDGIFGDLLHACVPNAFVAFVPGVVAHRPPQIRTSSWRAEIEAASAVDMPTIVRLLLAITGEPSGRDTATSLVAAGTALVRLAARPADLEARLRAEIARAMRQRQARIDQLLDAHRGSPGYWARDMSATREVLGRALAAGCPWWPASLAAAHGEERAKSLVFKAIHDLGTLWIAWPELWAAARDLAQDGVRLSAPVGSP